MICKGIYPSVVAASRRPGRKGTGPCFRPTTLAPKCLHRPKNGPVPGHPRSTKDRRLLAVGASAPAAGEVQYSNGHLQTASNVTHVQYLGSPPTGVLSSIRAIPFRFPVRAPNRPPAAHTIHRARHKSFPGERRTAPCNTPLNMAVIVARLSPSSAFLPAATPTRQPPVQHQCDALHKRQLLHGARTPLTRSSA